ncbi:MAG: outer membrane beta-barrel protein [Saprospiraceae bacterium]
MKIKFFQSLTIVFLSLGLSAQTEQMPTSKEDTFRINLKEKEILIIDKNQNNKKENVAPKYDIDLDNNKDELKKENTNPEQKKKSKKFAEVDFLEIDLGVNLLFNTASPKPDQLIDDLEVKPFESWSWTFNFLPTRVYLGSKNAMLMTAFGWRYSSYEFKNKLDFEPNKTLVYTKDNNIKSSEFDIHQLQIPLMVYFESNKIKGLGKVGFGFGGYGGLLVHQEHEVKTISSKKNIEEEEDFGFNPYRYGLSTRIDVGPFKLFGNYDLSSTWDDTDFKNAEVGLWFDF